MRVLICDDVVAARGEEFRIDGLDIQVLPDSETLDALVAADPPDVIFMDYSMGAGKRTGGAAVAALRAAGYAGRIVAMSSDQLRNQEMLAAGASDALPRKAVLRAYLVSLARGK